MAFLVERDRSSREDAGLRREPTACDGMDPRDELLEIERLDEVVVGTRPEARDPVFDLITGSQLDDHQAGVFSNSLCELHAVDPWKHQIEDDELRLGALQLGKRLVSV